MYKDCAKVHKLSDLLALQAFLYWSQIEGYGRGRYSLLWRVMAPSYSPLTNIGRYPYLYFHVRYRDTPPAADLRESCSGRRMK